MQVHRVTDEFPIQGRRKLVGGGAAIRGNKGRVAFECVSVLRSETFLGELFLRSLSCSLGISLPRKSLCVLFSVLSEMENTASAFHIAFKAHVVSRATPPLCRTAFIYREFAQKSGVARAGCLANET